MKNSSEIFGPSLYLFYLIFAGVAAALGNGTALLYLLLIKLGYAVVVSIIIHGWGKNRDILIEKAENMWTVNINGIPVNETQHSLKNLHFRSEGEMTKSYRNIILPKSILLTVLMVISMQYTYTAFLQSEFAFSLFFSAMVSVFLLIKSIEVIGLYNKIGTNRWEVNLYEIGDGFYYSAFIPVGKERYSSFLGKVFK